MRVSSYTSPSKFLKITRHTLLIAYSDISQEKRTGAVYSLTLAGQKFPFFFSNKKISLITDTYLYGGRQPRAAVVQRVRTPIRPPNTVGIYSQ